MPILGRFDIAWWKRFTGWPFFPIAPPFPLLPVPLPSKWHTRFLDAIPIHEQYPPEAAEDREIVRSISNSVRDLMQRELLALVKRRRHVFWGRLTDPSGQDQSRLAEDQTGGRKGTR